MACYCGQDRHDHYKILNSNLVQMGFKYKLGLNTDVIPFSPYSCTPGGLNYSTGVNIAMFATFGTLIADVIVPEGSQVSHLHNLSKASSLVISNIRPLVDFEKWKDPDWCMKAVQVNGLVLQFIKNQTFELCYEAIRQDILALEFVQKQTYQLCRYAVCLNPYAITYIRNRTKKMWREAVRLAPILIYDEDCPYLG